MIISFGFFFPAEVPVVQFANETGVNLTIVTVDFINKTKVTVDYFAPTGEKYLDSWTFYLP